MRLSVKAAGLVIAAFLMAPSLAAAHAPILKSVSQKNLRLSATFSAPDAGVVTVYVAKAPQQNADGSFYTANIADSEVLTAQQISSGTWTEQSELTTPGHYWVMIGANPAQTCVLGDGTINPSCANGDSNVVSVTVSPPTTQYKASVLTTHASHGTVSLRLTATPLGASETLKLCYALTVRKRPSKHCINRHLTGSSLHTSVVDLVKLSTRGMSKREAFTWSLSGRTVARLTVKLS